MLYRALLASMFASLLAAGAAEAQATSPPLIRDNSFLVEEAYNQERGVVQHISSYATRAAGRGWDYTFTQEWPLAGQRHQISYNVPLSRTDIANGARTGIGDVALNYRYQVVGMTAGKTAFAPRMTVRLPTGASRSGLGAGGAGVQLSLPFSAELPAALVAHTNVAATYTPRARNALGASAAIRGYSMGQSVVWLAHPRLNLLLEAAWIRTQDVAGPKQAAWGTEVLLSPGIRGAFNFASGLQIVPGLAFPIGMGPSRGDRSVFVYLSFEHPFTRQTQ